MACGGMFTLSLLMPTPQFVDFGHGFKHWSGLEHRDG